MRQAGRTRRALRGLAVGLVVWSGVAGAQSSTMPYLRKPDIHGDQVVFTAEGDLWLGSLTGGTAQRITAHAGTEINAHFSPDGKMLAFTAYYDGNTDVYVMPVNGGDPKRLTYDPSGALVLGWTPDGQNVLYRSRSKSAEKRNQLLSVPAKGGMPTRLPIPEVEHAAMNPDSKQVAYVPVSAEWQHWFRYQGGEADDIWLTDLSTHTFKRLTKYEGIDTTPVWVGNTLYFVSERDGLGNLYKLDTNTGKATAVTHYADYAVSYPASDGKKIVFQHGHELAVYDPGSNKTRELAFTLNSDRIHARARRVPVAPAVNNADLGPTGKRVLVEARGQILSVPTENGDARILASLPGSRSQNPTWSPDGKQVAFVSDRSGENQIWLCPAVGPGEPRQLTRDHKGPLGAPLWSPDGKTIAIGDHEMRVMLVDATTGAITTVAQGDRGGTYHAISDAYRFSPDGRWLVFAQSQTNWNSVIFLYDIANKKKIAVTSSEMNSYAPAFDATGKYLLFLSDRELDPGRLRGVIPDFDRTTKVSLLTLAADTPSPFLLQNDEEGGADAPPSAPMPAPMPPKVDTKPDAAKPEMPKPDTPAVPPPPAAPKLPPTKIDLDGLSDRIIDVPLPGGRYRQVEGLDGKLLLINYTDNGPQLLSFDLKRKQATILLTPVTGMQLSFDHKKLMLMSGRDIAVVDAGTGPMNPGTGHVDVNSLTLQIEPQAEWKQMFEEAWRIARDFFYDPNLHGVDWQAVHKKYMAQLPAVSDRADLNRILGDMIAELNVGHAYVGGGDMGDLGTRPLPMGYLGADLEAMPNTNAVRIVSLLKGDGFDLDARSPLLAPGVNVKPGDYILAVAGQPVRPDQDIQALLVGTAGQVVTLTVNSKPTLEGARQVRIRPMGNESKARYYAWVESRRDYVRKNGGENLGYIHIPDMEGGGMQEFTKHYSANLPKDGLIFDVRGNGGGYISAQLLAQIASKPYSYFKPRYGESWTRINWGYAGYSVALCNENSGSNAEEFCDAFQRLKVGPVIGTRTWGGEVGSGGGYALLDGGSISIPNYGEWVPDGKDAQGKPASQWIIEGTGAQPDVIVEQDPAAVLAGRDPQLDRAIAYLKAQIEKQPVAHPRPPAFPNKAYRPANAVTRTGK